MDSRRARRLADPGLQPERTSLAWLRTLLGYLALMAFALRHAWHQAGMLFWISLVIMAIVMLVAYLYARQRNRMDVTRSDFVAPHLVRGRLVVVTAVCLLATLFALSHLHQIHFLLGGN